MPYISGKQAFLEILKQEGVSVMFGNPGTTELPLMDGLAREPGIRYVLALQEAVAIAMADGYAQASGGLAAVNVQCRPGTRQRDGHAVRRVQGALAAARSPPASRPELHGDGEILWSELPPVASAVREMDPGGAPPGDLPDRAARGEDALSQRWVPFSFAAGGRAQPSAIWSWARRPSRPG